MKRQQVMGLVLLVGGIAVLIVGLRLSPRGEEETTISTRLGQPATWIVLSGAGAGLLGSLLLLRVSTLDY